MKTLKTILFLSFLLPLKIWGQLPTHIVQQLLHADTVMLVSHLQTDGIVIMDDKGKKQFSKKLVEKRVLNKELIVKHALLTTNDRQELADILKQPFKDRKVETCQFIPFNAIVFIESGKASSIEVSLECRAYKYIQGNKEELVQMDKAKWMKLSAYFERFEISNED
mgnify:CR=1 FL=1